LRLLLVLFVAVPILEMMVLINVGQHLGALTTVGLVFLTAAVGYALIKQQGAMAVARAREKVARGETPASEMAQGLFLAVGGALLLTPGFITDTLGFFCLIPGLRTLLIGWGLRNFVQVRMPQEGFQQASRPSSKGGDTIEGEYQREK